MTDPQDIHFIRQSHYLVHDRLENWSRYVRFSGTQSQCTPMFRHYRSYRGWHPVILSVPVDQKDASKVEKIIALLPEMHREAVRWWYVYSEWGVGVKKICRVLAVQKDTLIRLVHDGRSMMQNNLDTRDDYQYRIAVKSEHAHVASVSHREAEPSQY